MSTAHENTHDEHGELGHIVPMKVLVGTFVSLLLLTVITVAVAHVDLGSLNLLVAMAVATVKACVVVLFFMHLRYDRPFHAVLFIGALLFVVLFVTFVLLDSRQYQPDVIPGHAPAMIDR